MMSSSTDKKEVANSKGTSAKAMNASTSSSMPTWPLCKAVALEVVNELGLDYYNDPKHLTFDEVLRLLARTRYDMTILDSMRLI